MTASWRLLLTLDQALAKIKKLTSRKHRHLNWWFEIEDVGGQRMRDDQYQLRSVSAHTVDCSCTEYVRFSTPSKPAGRYFLPNVVILTVYRDAVPPINKVTAG